MNKKSNTKVNLPFVLGILGMLAGIGLMFGENKFIGVFGSIASAGLAYKGYQDLKESKK
jgi:Kef-type K+ transport system membrane component KefB